MRRVLGGETIRPPTLVEALGRPVWIDFVADTGDDRDVSAAVARILFREYEVCEGDGTRSLPRGEVLLMGGVTAYPVATADEIHARVIVPWNETLKTLEGPHLEVPQSRRASRPDHGPRRVLLGIPGNHDWYDGLDGFARMFRRSAEPVAEGDADPPSRKRRRPRGIKLRLRSKEGRKTGFVARQFHLDEVGGLVGIIITLSKSVRAFLKGVGVSRRKRLVLQGYEPVQESSYWTLPVAPKLELWGVDRQLGRLDFRQQSYFRARRKAMPRHTHRLRRARPCRRVRGTLRARRADAVLLQARRWIRTASFTSAETCITTSADPSGDSLHVIAGGGGAFLHGTRISTSPCGPAAFAYPNAAMTRALVAQVPVKLMLGHGGLLVHAALALIASLELGASRRARGLRS